jgi:hypothetical protein
MTTPLRDGMNLAAKEFLATQDPDDPGVLMLSQFAGAAVELDQALIVHLLLNFHPTAVRVSGGFTPLDAGGATCDRRSWSGLRSRSHVAWRLAA